MLRKLQALTLENGGRRPSAAPMIAPTPVIPDLKALSQCTDQIQGGVKEYPNQIYEVPIDCRGLYRILFFIIQTLPSITPNNRKENQAREHVQRVHSCHHKECCTCYSRGGFQRFYT